MEIGCPKLAIKAVKCSSGDTHIFWLPYPEALTTTLEGLSKEKSGGCRSLADEWNEEGPTRRTKEK